MYNDGSEREMSDEMKRVLISLAVIFLLSIAAFFIVHNMQKEQSIVATKDIKKIKDAYQYYDEAKLHVDELAMEQLDDLSMRNDFFKLKDGSYFNLRTYMVNKVGYIMNSYLTFDKTGKTKVAFPKVISHQYKINNKIIDNTWSINTPAGKLDYQSGAIDRSDDPVNVFIESEDGKRGVLMDKSLKKDVTFIGNNGEWLDAANNRIGTDAPLRKYNDPQTAASAVLKQVTTPGQLVAKLSNGEVTFFFYRNKYGPVDEYTVIPVLNDNTAGIYHKFTLAGFNESIIDYDFKYAVKGNEYHIIFNDDFEHADKFKHKKLSDNIIIAVK